jgi:hypothetical protein
MKTTPKPMTDDAPTVEAAREHRSGCDLFDWDSRSNDPKAACTCCALAKQAYIAQRFRAETESMRQAQGDDNAEMVAIARGDRDRKLDALIAAVRSDAIRGSADPRTECCNVAIEGDHRYCPKCGWECRLAAPPSTADPRTAFEAGWYAAIRAEHFPEGSKTLTQAVDAYLASHTPRQET